MFINFHPMGVDLFHANEQKDMTELTVTFRNFVSASKNEYFRRHKIYSKCSLERGIICLYIKFMGNSE